ncbi:helix-turn-helix transcriptional regulator [Methylobacterium sp. GXS13]|uniref:helix-turn-helix domain-containing protein n=1 Tax=Methylobacterium sp. GXS13 TaxID=1730094 RepID=UPI001910A78C|nr:helix-turn-helix transcriptional regulator [Methylobacterium sp. GXS13]
MIHAILGNVANHIERIAQTVGPSKRQLERVFRQLVGKSVQKYLRDLRVLYGRWLLANSPQTITEVATECGFSDVSHFNRLFRRSFGCSPSTMRRGDSQGSAQASEEWNSLRALAGSPDSQGDFHCYLNDETAGVLGVDRFLSCERRPYAQ